LRLEDCSLPEKGWGQLLLSGSTPTVGSKWTDNGQAHEQRGLKGRPRKAKRIIPIPPQLVSVLRDHIRRHGVAQDGRLFRTERGGTLYKSGYVRTWKPPVRWRYRQRWPPPNSPSDLTTSATLACHYV
jgi:integrase